MGAEVIAEELKAAELALREAVATHGTTHPIVLERLDSFIELARKAGNEMLAAKLEDKAKIIRQALQLAAPAPATGTAATATVAPAVAPAASVPPAKAPTPTVAPAPAAEEKASAEDQSFVEKHLFNSRGEHVAVVFDGHIYSPVGKYLGRWDEELDAFIDDKGNYLGQAVEENRLAYDPNWHYKYMNFGTKSNAGSRTGWSRQPDTDRILLPLGFVDVNFAETNDE